MLILGKSKRLFQISFQNPLKGSLTYMWKVLVKRERKGQKVQAFPVTSAIVTGRLPFQGIRSGLDKGIQRSTRKRWACLSSGMLDKAL
jgi:hypothetical protein